MYKHLIPRMSSELSQHKDVPQTTHGQTVYSVCYVTTRFLCYCEPTFIKVFSQAHKPHALSSYSSLMVQKEVEEGVVTTKRFTYPFVPSACSSAPSSGLIHRFILKDFSWLSTTNGCKKKNKLQPSFSILSAAEG